MKWVSSIHISDSLETAVQKATTDIKKSFGRHQADLGFIFFSWSFREEMIDLWPSLRNEWPVKNLIGCTAGGVIGGEREVEDQPALSVTVAQLPHVDISLFHLTQDKLPSTDGSPRPWRNLIQTSDKGNPHFVLLSDPFSLDPDPLVSGLDFAFPHSVKVGGLASGGTAPSENLLIINEKIYHKGAVGVALNGKIKIEPVVAQGCRPIGDPLTITACKDNVLLEVNNRPPLSYLSELYTQLNDRDKELLTHSLFLGIVTDSFKDKPKHGDFLIRNIVGLDQEKGILAVGSRLRKGQTIQFHLRDANTSHDDLKLMLSKSNHTASEGAVLFSCLGRGHRLYGKPDHDISVMKSVLGNIPVGGFFCNGEIGPISGKTYLHGYTSSIGLFRSSDIVQSH